MVKYKVGFWRWLGAGVKETIRLFFTTELSILTFYFCYTIVFWLTLLLLFGSLENVPHFPLCLAFFTVSSFLSIFYFIYRFETKNLTKR